MSSAVALAQRSESEERTTFAIDVLADQVDHLRRLTIELLELARIDAGRDDATRELVDVAAVVRRLAALHGVADAVVEPTEPVMHELSSIRLDRVLANLLENAARYGGGATRIACSHDDGTLRLVVEDDGRGGVSRGVEGLPPHAVHR